MVCNEFGIGWQYNCVIRSKMTKTCCLFVYRDNGPEGMEPDGIIEVSPSAGGTYVFLHAQTPYCEF